MKIEDLMNLKGKRDYLIPDVLPTPSVVLIYGAGGDGKSMSAWAIAKHVAAGQPFVVRGKLVPVEKGPVLLLNGDQPLIQLKEQLQEVDFPITRDTHIQTDWSLQHYAQFIKIMNQVQPKLVVIDSLIGCSGGRAFDENKSDFATPLYWLTRNNGGLFPATTILIIHHANKTGGFRGTSAIRDAVDETWSLQMPSEQQIEKVGKQSRIITLEKSRSGNRGKALLMRMEDDLSFSISDFTPEVDDADVSPTKVIGLVLLRLRTAYPRALTRAELNADPSIGGSVTAIRKALQRLENKKVIVSTLQGQGTSSVEKVYKAVLACGEVEQVVPPQAISSDTNGSTLGQDPGTNPICPTPGTTCPTPGTKSTEKEDVPPICPTPKPSPGKESALDGTNLKYPHARGQRTPEELQKLKNDAWMKWGSN